MSEGIFVGGIERVAHAWLGRDIIDLYDETAFGGEGCGMM